MGRRTWGTRGKPAPSFPCSLYPVVPMNSRVITEKEIEVNGFLFPKNVSGAEELGLPGLPCRPKLMCCLFLLCRPSLCSATMWCPVTLTSSLSQRASSLTAG